MNEIDVFEIENILIYMVWTWWIYVVGIYTITISLNICIVWLYFSGHQHHQLYVLYVSQPVLIICQLDFLGSSCQNLALYLETRPALLAAHIEAMLEVLASVKKWTSAVLCFYYVFHLYLFIQNEKREEKKNQKRVTMQYRVFKMDQGHFKRASFWCQAFSPIVI